MAKKRAKKASSTRKRTTRTQKVTTASKRRVVRMRVPQLESPDTDRVAELVPADTIGQAHTGTEVTIVGVGASAGGLEAFSSTVRDLCIFARQDLTRDPPFSRLDLILCRNVLIYMDVVLQQRLISVFHYALNPEGFLVLGQAETVGSQVGLFSLADKKYRIYRKKVTAYNLIAGDVDRPIGHIKPNIDCPELEQLILESIDSVAPVEREVRDQQGRWYSLRIRPYKNVENKIDGAVLTLFDIDVPKKSEHRLRLAKEFTEALVGAIDQPVMVLDRGLRVQLVNESVARGLGKPAAAIVGEHLSELDGAWNLASLVDRIPTWPRGAGFERVPLEFDGGGSRRTGWMLGRWLTSHESPDTELFLLIISMPGIAASGGEPEEDLHGSAQA